MLGLLTFLEFSIMLVVRTTLVCSADVHTPSVSKGFHGQISLTIFCSPPAGPPGAIIRLPLTVPLQDRAPIRSIS